VSIGESLNRFRAAFRDELGNVRAGLSDEGNATGVDRLGAYLGGGAATAGGGMGDHLASTLAGWDRPATGGLAGLAGAGWRSQQGESPDPFRNFSRAREYSASLRQQEETAKAAQVRTQGTLAAGDWSGPASADDNKTLDAGKVDQWIVATRPNSPLRGMGGYILQQANAAGVSVPLLMGILLKESELGTTAGPGFNIAGVGGEGNFAQYGSWQQALDGAIRNLAGPTYKGKSAEEQVGNWFTGPQRWAQSGLAATDSTGGRNGNVSDYLNGPVASAYSGLGVPFNQRATGTRRAGTVADAESVMPVQGFTGEIRTHWDSDERGATDIFAAQGTPVLALTNGQVTYAAYDPTGGWAVMIRSDDGTDEYYAHLFQQPMVRPGQRINAGQQLGGVGNTGNAATVPGFHLHLGKGWGVQQGVGPHGGAGMNFDLVSYLQARQQRGRSAAVPTTRPATTGRPIRY
jgi:murein DD-endopeptidase MepM/ murein hydrolase activator NlpD